MLSDLRAPRELVLLMRLVAVLGATKIAAVVYYDLLSPQVPTAAEIAASEREIRELAEEGEARVLADFRRRAAGVLAASRRCAVPGSSAAACRWAEIWLERYERRAHEILASAREYPAEITAAARDYQRAADVLRAASSGAKP